MRNVIFIALLSLSFSNIIYIPDDYPSIQEGIDASTEGDTVLIADGEYFENLYLNKEITLGSYYVLDGDTTHRDNTIINGSNALDDAEYGSCLFITGDDIYPIVNGFTFTGGKGTMTNEVIEGNTVSKRRGGGVTVYQSNATVTYNRFYNNGYIETEDINGGGAASFIGTGVGVGRETPRDINRDWVVDFSHNIYDDNSADLGSTFLSWHYNGDIDMSNCYYDVYNCEEEEVTLYWVYTDSTTFDFEEGDGELCLNPDLANVYVSPQGDDWSNDGTQDFPFRTIDKAFSIIAPDSDNIVTVNLDEGTYAPSTTGQNYPIFPLSYINLIGAGEEVTILDAEADSLNLRRVITMENVEGVTISDLTITGGIAAIDEYDDYGFGGGIYLTYSAPLLTNLTIHGNTAYFNGGGIYLKLSHPTLIRVNIINNNTVNSGGGIFCSHSNPSLENVNISDNYSNMGGGIFCYMSNMTLDNVSVSNNVAENRGGGITFWESINPNLNNVSISGNSSNYGGGMSFIYSTPKLVNVSINDNFATNRGGGISVHSNSYPTLNQVTISRNSANLNGGIYCFSSTNLSIINSIIWENLPPLIYSDSLSIFYSNIEGGWEGEGNIDIDPLFTNPDSSDYTLQPDSPCIDTGTPFFVWEGDTLINIPDSDYYGIAPDMGAFEWMELDIEELPLPKEYTLHSSYPNPFNPITTITYSIPEPTDVTIIVYDILGKQIAELINDYIPSGNHQIRWNADNKSTGVYFIKMSTHTFTQTQKVILVK